MITLNNRDYPWSEGLTIRKLLEDNNYVYPRIIVMINDTHVEPNDYEHTIIYDGDNVKAIHLLAGG